MDLTKQIRPSNYSGIMELKDYGITLEPLNIESIETVRIWRNQTQVNQFMDYQKIISKEDQLDWFKNIQNSNSAYYIIKKGNDQIGMIHLNQINNATKSAEAGIFIGNNDFNGTGITLGASILLLDYAFTTLNLEIIYAKVKNNNSNAIKYNQLLGFTEDKAFNSEFTIWKLKSPAFFDIKPKLIQLLY